MPKVHYQMIFRALSHRKLQALNILCSSLSSQHNPFPLLLNFVFYLMNTSTDRTTDFDRSTGMMISIERKALRRAKIFSIIYKRDNHLYVIVCSLSNGIFRYPALQSPCALQSLLSGKTKWCIKCFSVKFQTEFMKVIQIHRIQMW